MSQIDQYKHECIGIGSCPSSYDIVFGRSDIKEVPLYRLGEDADDWQAKKGDLLLGGGSGESAAFRLSMPEALWFSTDAGWEDFEQYDPEVMHAYWDATDAFRFGEGYAKLGWHPDQMPIEAWLEDQILAFVLHEYAEIYSPLVGRSSHIVQHNTIFRLPTAEETNTLRQV
jgi:hypothetical protein